MGFEYPLALALLLILLLLVRRRRCRAKLPLPPDADGGRPSLRVRLLWIPGTLGILAFAACVIAAAGPHAGTVRQADRRMARDIVLAMDLSESMKGVDFGLDGERVSRLDAAVHLAGRFIEGREGDRIGIVAFGRRALTQCPLTFDRGIAKRLLGYLEAGMVGSRTALGTGIALGVARLERGGALVLLSDGRNTAGDVSPQQAARAAAARDVTIYAIGVGGEGPVPIPARMPSGRVRMEMKDYPLDEETLRALAAATDGIYLRADSTPALERAFDGIDRLEKKPASAYRTVPTGRWSDIAAAAALGALALLMAASSLYLRTAPSLL